MRPEASVKKILLILTTFVVPTPVYAQELLLLGGSTHESSLSETTYAWDIEYAHTITDNFYATFDWYNEGHFNEHHRDGPATQIWRRINFFQRRFSIVFGIGLYSYFDTAQAELDASYANDHGWGLIYSAGLTWKSQQRWLYHVRANRFETDTNIDTSMFLLGIGYQLLQTPSSQGHITDTRSLTTATENNELAFFVGRTILNSFGSEYSTATTFEYRRHLEHFIDVTLGLLHEGAHRIIRRNGITTQIWLIQSTLHNHMTLGIGAGTYFVINKEHRGDIINDDERISGIITPTVSYRIGQAWFTRISWNRIITGYNRDTDVLLFGAGYRY